jgi:hypothetical protein
VDGTRRELSRAHCPGEHPATTRKRVEHPGFGASGPGRARKLSTFPALAFSLAVDGVSFAGTGTLGSWSFSPRSRCGPGPHRATRVRHGTPVPCRTRPGRGQPEPARGLPALIDLYRVSGEHGSDRRNGRHLGCGANGRGSC